MKCRQVIAATTAIFLGSCQDYTIASTLSKEVRVASKEVGLTKPSDSATSKAYITPFPIAQVQNSSENRLKAKKQLLEAYSSSLVDRKKIVEADEKALGASESRLKAHTSLLRHRMEIMEALKLSLSATKTQGETYEVINLTTLIKFAETDVMLVRQLVEICKRQKGLDEKQLEQDNAQMSLDKQMVYLTEMGVRDEESKLRKETY